MSAGLVRSRTMFLAYRKLLGGLGDLGLDFGVRFGCDVWVLGSGNSPSPEFDASWGGLLGGLDGGYYCW